MSDEKKLSKARQALVDRVLSRLDAGAIPWDNGMQGAAMPYNATNETRYRGMNALNLLLTAYERGISDPRWMTFNQATDAGYKVKKGAKGVPIELYKIIDKRTGKDADMTKIREETKDMTFAERQAWKKENLQSFARSYYVFNASDVIGIEPYRAPELTSADISARNERIERIIAASEAPIFYDGNGRNYYGPIPDEIHLTARNMFTSDEFFYNTALHEMAHSTGHSSRLNRPSGHFGSKEYAREELVAEISSVLTAAELGLDHSDRVIENSAEYVRSWAQLIRDNPQTLIDATFDASHATDYICNRERQVAHAPEEKTQKENIQSSTSQPYSRYAALQEKYPDAVVVMRIGDFYEVMGEKAKTVSDELDLTLTGRNVGLPDRIPMCGFPYHVMEQYTEKILEKHAVAIVENEGEEKYILSHGEAHKTPLESLADEKTQKETEAANKAAPTAQQHTKPLVVNFYGGPSSGKTTAALELSAALKKAGYNVEYVSEFAKDLVLEGKTELLKDQKYVTDGQYNRLDRIRNNVDIIVTDSPVLLGLVYGKYNGISDEYAKQIRSYYDSFDNFNIFVERPSGAAFQTEGRVHDEQQSVKLDGEIKEMLAAQKVFYGGYRRDDIPKTVERIATTYNRLYGSGEKKKTQKENKAPDATKPAPRPPFKPDNIPAEMKTLPNWVAYQRLGMNENGHYNKKLYDCNITEKNENGALAWAKSNDPTTWATFDKADAYRKRFKRDGVAFGLTEEAGIVCIDLDKSIDENGKLSEAAQRFLDASGGTYAERSTSGHGIHIFCLGHAPENYGVKGDKIDLEVFDSKRMISMTGDIYGAAASTLKPVSPELMDLLKANLKEQPKIVPRKFDRATASVSDVELIDRISKSRRGSDFNALMRGELLVKRPDGSGDPSGSDYMLCNMLAFFSGGDVAQVERIIKSSGLYRPTKPDKYYTMTARNACDKLQATYDPSYRKSQTKQRPGKKSGSGGNGRNDGAGR